MKDATRLTQGGRRHDEPGGPVNRPVYRASTILSPTVADLRARQQADPADAVTYAVHGTPDTFALEEALAELEGGVRTRLCYGPTGRFAARTLKRLGVETSFYDPLIGAGIRDLVRPTTRVIFAESPGSLTFEVQDIPALAEEAHRAGALLLLDNTWASPLYFKAFEHGVDVSIQALTKYVGGHADLLLGAVTTTRETYPALRDGWLDLGLSGPPDPVFLAARGLRTLDVRLARHWENGLKVAEWLKGRAEVVDVLHPALPDDPGHALWKRDFLGASSLFGFTLKPELGTEAHLAALLDGLELFGMGSSWGGFESLILPSRPRRHVAPWPRPGRAEGHLMRIHVGLDDPDDLIADLAAGFERMARAG